eukprot:TRINITY_DN626_c0_g1_i14.p1 TRINITY_DN626_c0_g1~~TRINITY_DN626_c0_g1_i14.p1  ORF type:complete len:298 (-),score=49.37 TRINITY_DN626_c0_g1_i14:63-956(-)
MCIRDSYTSDVHIHLRIEEVRGRILEQGTSGENDETILLSIQGLTYRIGVEGTIVRIPSGFQRLLISYENQMKLGGLVTKKLVMYKEEDIQIKVAGRKGSLKKNSDGGKDKFEVAKICVIAILSSCFLISLKIILSARSRLIAQDIAENPFINYVIESVSVEKEEENECPVCLEPYKEREYTYFPCKRHLIHIDCLNQWLELKGNKKSSSKYCVYRCNDAVGSTASTNVPVSSIGQQGDNEQQQPLSPQVEDIQDSVPEPNVVMSDVQPHQVLNTEEINIHPRIAQSEHQMNDLEQN